jgi:hypothetical protein
MRRMARIRPKTRQVRLLRISAGHWGHGKKGDVVTVPLDQAAILIANGHAEDPDTPPREPPVIPPDPPAVPETPPATDEPPTPAAEPAIEQSPPAVAPSPPSPPSSGLLFGPPPITGA